ncbi:hypothetical protein ACJ41O_003814 [Fusarium nematophilum]
MMSPTQDLPTLPSYRGMLGIAPDQLDRFTATKPVHFLVGHDRAEFSIYPDLMSCLSAPLTTLVNCETKGFLERFVTCENVDKDVFSRFVQFVYTGAYTGFPPAEKDGPAGQIEEVSEVTASVDEKLPDRSTQGAPISL